MSRKTTRSGGPTIETRDDDAVAIDAEEEVEVQPGDSVSQVSAGSYATNASSRAKLKAKAAILKAKANALQKQHQIEVEEQKLKQKREVLEIETEIAITQAEVDAQSTNSGSDTEVKLTNMTQLNPNAEPWPEPQMASRPNAATMRVEPNDTINGMRAMIAAIHLPHAQLTCFDGDPLQYWPFIRAFKNSVENVCDDNVTRLTRLLQYCTGKAKRAIQSCSVMPPSEGYYRALQLLKDRFGNEYTIAEAWIKTVTEGKPVSHAESLRQFADDLRNCKETLEAMNYMSEVNTQRVIVKLVDRLPRYLQTRWVRHVSELRMKGSRVAEFNDVVKYVEAAAEEANDPVYGRFVDKVDRKGISSRPQQFGAGREVSTGNKIRSFNVVTSRACAACGAEHSINSCAQFKALSVGDRCQLVKANGLCFNCLKPGHKATSCRHDRSCSVPGCGRRHSSYLHKVSVPTETNRPAVVEPTVAVSSCVSEQSCHVTGAGTRTVMLPLVPVKVQSADGRHSVTTLALLDSGSTTSFCTERLAEALNLPRNPDTLSLSTMGCLTTKITTYAVSLDVLSIDRRSHIRLDKVYTRPCLPIGKENRPTTDDVRQWPHLQGIEFHDAELEDAELLIGQDHPEVLAPLEIRKHKTNCKAPYAVRTTLGWTVQGPLKASINRAAVVNFVRADADLQKSVERFWNLDSVEAVTNDVKGMSRDDKRAMTMMEDTVQLSDGHYELSIPFKQRPVTLPNNRSLAEARLQSLSRKLGKDANFREKYCRNMDDLVVKGYASKVERAELNRDVTVWYLPHHAVINPKKPDKVRVVFDCAAKFGGTSLNDKVLQGPDMTNQLIGILLRFREEAVAIMADIEAMFCQVRVTGPDRNFLRYLWWPGGDFTQEPDTYHMNVHLFGGTWSPSCCGFVLRKVASDNETEFSAETVNTVLRNFYVDDCLKSVRNEEQAVKLVNELIMLLKRGGFKLTGFVSTSRKVLMSVPEVDRSRALRNVDLGHGEQLPTERALGVSWNVEDDSFVFTNNPKKRTITRRGMLSTMCSVYDPAGYLSPFTLKAKLLMQELTRKKVDWDELMPEQELHDWLKWLEDMTVIEKVRIPRCLRMPGPREEYFELHHFSDASNSAYGAVTYLRAVNDGTCKLLLAKSRLAPLKTVTIPRLELMAATLAVKLDLIVKRELDLPILRTIFWTDSTVVLQYIRCDHKRFHTFVANRVAMIRETSDPKQWRHVPSEDNVADDISRGLDAEQLVSRSRWWNGPVFLTRSEAIWPSNQFSGSLKDDDPEVKTDKPSTVSFVAACRENTTTDVDMLLTRRSNWFKLKKDVAWLRRYMMYLKRKCDESVMLGTGPLSVAELLSAEAAILRFVQQQSFPEEIDHLNANRKVPKGSKLYRLCPLITSDGIMCVGGRLRNASISVTAKHSTILPKRHHIVDLIIRHVHETNGHVGREHVLSLLHEKYRIIRGRSSVRRILSSCVTCRKLTARRCEQKMADLPVDRVAADKPPFTYVGVDLFGPFIIRRARSDVKRYGCLFTCLVTRAVHIEVTYSLDTDSFLNAVMRFISRRGRPEIIRSDNATNFKSGEKELKDGIKAWNHAHISERLSQNEIEWKYNPPGASHMGGVWERLIRSVRQVLNLLLKEQTLDDESLYTVMCLAEHIVNSRPLTVVSDDINDLEALTPVHLLNLRRQSVLPPGIFDQRDNYVKRRWKQVQYIADIFWRRWTREYLPLLQQRQKWCTTNRDLQIGDIVLLMEDSPRNCWPLARIVDTHRSDDGHVRSATVKTRISTVVRPITKLCLLESFSTD